MLLRLAITIAAALGVAIPACAAEDRNVFEGTNGKQVVLISGDEEYRSEESLTQLAKILSTHGGYTCTVLYAINPNSGIIDPNYVRNIPGLEALKTADLMVIFTRFRNLPDEQMQHIDDYLKAGKPVMGLRTATHAFKPNPDGPWAQYGDSYSGDMKEWEDGFGRLILGEKWISHHGEHKHESTRGRIPAEAKDDPILRGIADGAIWCSTDVYGVRLPMQEGVKPLVLGEVVKRAGAYDEADSNFGMRENDAEPNAEKNEPMMPVAWTKTYQVPGGKEGQVFTTTMGAATDIQNEALRRLLVNAVYALTGREAEIPSEGSKVGIVGDYMPTQFGFHDSSYWAERALTPAKLAE